MTKVRTTISVDPEIALWLQQTNINVSKLVTDLLNTIRYSRVQEVGDIDIMQEKRELQKLEAERDELTMKIAEKAILIMGENERLEEMITQQLNKAKRFRESGIWAEMEHKISKQ